MAFAPEMVSWLRNGAGHPVLHRSRVLTQKTFSDYNRGLFSPWQPGKQDRVAAERVGVPGRSTEIHEVDRGAKEWSVRRAGGSKPVPSVGHFDLLQTELCLDRRGPD